MALDVFISYSHKDRALRDELATERPAVLRRLIDGQAGEGGTAARTTEAEETAAPLP